MMNSHIWEATRINCQTSNSYQRHWTIVVVHNSFLEELSLGGLTKPNQRWLEEARTLEPLAFLSVLDSLRYSSQLVVEYFWTKGSSSVVTSVVVRDSDWSLLDWMTPLLALLTVDRWFEVRNTEDYPANDNETFHCFLILLLLMSFSIYLWWNWIDHLWNANVHCLQSSNVFHNVVCPFECLITSKPRSNSLYWSI